MPEHKAEASVVKICLFAFSIETFSEQTIELQEKGTQTGICVSGWEDFSGNKRLVWVFKIFS